MIIVGITGSIGMGKSTATKMLRDTGYDVFDADECAGRLSEKKEITNMIIDVFPTAAGKNGILNKDALRDIAFMNNEALDCLEKILHPAIECEMKDFIAEKKNENKETVFLDIPLLFESGWNRYADFTAVITAPHFIQKRRVLKRRNMTPEYLEFLLKRQMPAAQKCTLADYKIYSCFGFSIMRMQLKQMIEDIKKKAQKNDTTNRS